MALYIELFHMFKRYFCNILLCSNFFLNITNNENMNADLNKPVE